jgi:hypothetical protein
MEENTKEKIFNALIKKYDVENLLCWNEFTLQDKLPKQAFLEVQWREMYISANKKLDELKRTKEEIIGEIFFEVKYPQLVENKEKNPYASIGAGLQNKDIERYVIPRDKRIKEINVKIEFNETIVDFFLTTYEAIKKNTWNMKNWLDVYKRM